MHRNRIFNFAPVLALAALLGLIPALAIPAPPARAAGGLALVKVVDGLSAPVYVTHAGDGSGRLFVVEQRGVIRIIEGGKLRPDPFLDIRDRVAYKGEAGLLSVAFPPDFASGGYFFVYYNHDGELAGPEPIDDGHNTGYDTVIARFRVGADPNRADPAGEERILVRSQPYENHNGGQIAFGPDGYLYIGLGDGGDGGDPQNQAQTLGTLLGKILRIAVGPTGTYTVPEDNPFIANLQAKSEIWHLGLRNPWRWSFDRATGDLWIADVGQGKWEEVDFAPAGQGGLHFGWRCKEGDADYNPNPPCRGALTAPVAVYGHDLGKSITGGYVYRGGAYPLLAGYYFYGDYVSGRIWSLRDVNGQWSQPAQEMDTDLSISSFGEDEAGELYVVDYNGGVYRLTSTLEVAAHVYLPVVTRE